MRLIALAIVVAVGAAALFFSRAPERQNAGLPVVHAGLIACPRLTNPCDRVNCNRINTRNIT
jgi:hypothetical protein